MSEQDARPGAPELYAWEGDWPYAVGTDAVVAWPSVSHTVALRGSQLRAEHNALNARTAGITRNGQAVEVNSGTAATSFQVLAGNQGAAMDVDLAGPYGRMWYRHNGTWRNWLMFYWSTAGNNEMFVQSNAEWNLGNAHNFFAGTFFGKVLNTGRALPATVQTDPDDPEQFDLAATVQALAEQVQTLTARIEQLETT